MRFSWGAAAVYIACRVYPWRCGGSGIAHVWTNLGFTLDVDLEDLDPVRSERS